jgi:hypothetical protein
MSDGGTIKDRDENDCPGGQVVGGVHCTGTRHVVRDGAVEPSLVPRVGRAEVPIRDNISSISRARHLSDSRSDEVFES